MKLKLLISNLSIPGFRPGLNLAPYRCLRAVGCQDFIGSIPSVFPDKKICHRTKANVSGKNLSDQIFFCKKNLGIKKTVHAVPFFYTKMCNYKLPLKACSPSMASNKALKFPLPKLLAPFRCMISKNKVGLSSSGLVKICKR